MITIVRVPYLGTAEEDVLVAEWLVAVGERVRKGEALALVETLKATFEVEAGCDGVLLRRQVEGGSRALAHAALGVIGPAESDVSDEELRALLEENGADAPSAPAELRGESPTEGSPVSTIAAAPAARKRARELGLDLAHIRGTGPDGLVRAVDVERARAEPASNEDGAVDPALLTRIDADPDAFARLSSGAKVALYREHGARIGADCHIGSGTVLRAERLVLGDGAYIGPNTSLDVRDFEAGVLMHFGRRCSIRCARVRLGDNAFFTDDVDVGGGGAMDPEAELIVGSHGFVGEHVHLNPCRTLTIGDEVVISRNAVVMTHSFGGSILSGYPNRFAPVTVREGAQLGIGTVLFPGVEVGAGAILMSGSSLVSSIPPDRMFAGVPAVDIKAAATKPTPEEFASIARGLVDEFARQLELRGKRVRIAAGDADACVTIEDHGRTHQLRYSETGFADDPAELAEELRVATRFGPDDWEGLPSDVAGIDLSVPAIRGPAGPLTDAFREFLRKRGVRLRPRAWAYRGGWL